jgi:transcriptional regulator with XRE-family HTH domain
MEDKLNLVSEILEKQIASNLKKLDKAMKENVWKATRVNTEELIRQLMVTKQLIAHYESGEMEDDIDSNPEIASLLED